MKKHPFSDGVTSDIDKKSLSWEHVGSLHATSHPVGYHYIYIYILYNNNVTTSSASRIRAFVSDVICDISFFCALVTTFPILGTAYRGLLSSVLCPLSSGVYPTSELRTLNFELNPKG